MEGRSALSLLGAAFSALILVPASSGLADDFEVFQSAQNAFEQQDYDGAASQLERLVGGEVPRVEGPLRLESRKYLAASYVFLGRPDDAERQFTMLLQEDPQHRLDPVAFSRDVLALFDSARRRLEEERVAAEREQARLEEARRRREAEQLLAERGRLLTLERLARVEVVEQQNSRWIAAIPFGPGQFQNRDDPLGWTFLTLGAATLVSSIITGALYLSFTDQLVDARSLRPSRALAVDEIESARTAALWINRVSFALLGVTGIASVIDAQVRFVPTFRTERERDLPESPLEDGVPDLLEPTVSLRVGLGTIQWSGTF